MSDDEFDIVVPFSFRLRSQNGEGLWSLEPPAEDPFTLVAVQFDPEFLSLRIHGETGKDGRLQHLRVDLLDEDGLETLYEGNWSAECESE